MFFFHKYFYCDDLFSSVHQSVYKLIYLLAERIFACFIKKFENQLSGLLSGY